MTDETDRSGRDEELARRAQELLSEGGPRSLAAIARALGVPGPVGDEEDEELELLLGLDDDRYAFLPASDEYVDLWVLLAGRTFTHRHGPGPAGEGLHPPVEPDLDLLLLPMLRSSHVPLSAGGRAERVDRGLESVLELPGGPVEPGVQGFRWDGTRLGIAPVDVDAAESGRIAERLRAGLDRSTADDGQECADLVDVLIELILDDPSAFLIPVAPVGELLERAGLSRRGDYIGRADRGWRTPLERGTEDREAFHREVYGFDDCCHRAFRALSRGFLEFRAGAVVDPATLGEAADHGQVAEAFVASEISGPLADGLADALGRFADDVIAAGTGPGHGAHFLRAIAHDLSDDVLAAEASLARSAEADPDFAAALAELAVVAEERGQVAVAIEHLRRLGAPADDPQLRRLRAAAAQTRSATGRNAPCPCGSGRKYKVCCLGRELPALAIRVGPLYAKAASFVHRPAERAVLLDLAEILTADDDGPGALVRALGEPLLMDIALFEQGMLARYLRVRGVLLPDDERALAASWPALPRALLEVTGVRPAALELRDTHDGADVRVSGVVAAPERWAAGDLLLARPCALGAENRFVGPVLGVSLRLRESVLDLISAGVGGREWCRWLAWATAPPEVANTEGEPLVFCEGRYRVGDPSTAAGALAAVLEEADPEGAARVFRQMLERDGRWVRGTITLTGDGMRVEANSRTRYARLTELAVAAVPDALLLGETCRALEDLVAEGPRPSRAPPPTPAQQELAAEFLEDYYTRWLDMRIPALGGLTPRQAAVDPTRRDDLRRLLREMEMLTAGPSPPVERLRAALALDPG